MEQVNMRQADIPSCSGRPWHFHSRLSLCASQCLRQAPQSAALARSISRNAVTSLRASCATGTAECPTHSSGGGTCTIRRDQKHTASSRYGHLQLASPAGVCGGVAALELLNALAPEASSAAETVPVEVLQKLLDNVEQLGVYGPIAFVATIIGAEMVPLFPTQPLSIASGLLFGALKGSAVALTGTTTAAMLAFQLSRRLGRRLAERVAAAEHLGEAERKKGIFSRVQQAIDSGSFQQQLVAVTVLRLTPVVPFSASNYLLGATPLRFEAYLGGSVLGLSFWCVLFASLGGASRHVLQSGLSLETLYADLSAKASLYTEDAALALAALGGAALLYHKFGPQAAAGSEGKCEEQEDDFEKV